MERPRRFASNSVLVIASLFISISIGEAIIRIIDGYSLRSWFLIKNRIDVDQPTIAEGYVKLFTEPEADPAWFSTSPPDISSPDPDPKFYPYIETANAVWRKRVSAINRWGEPFLGENPSYVWNAKSGRKCDALSFQGDESGKPIYRLIPHAVLGRMKINAFGHRGRDIDIRKPEKTFRVAFIGASTTIGQPENQHSYPELIEPWLNAWSERNGLGIRFETVNAGRYGFSSPEITAVLRTEVLPLSPDLVVYYEGSNQFDFRPVLNTLGVEDTISRQSDYSKPEIVANYSAIARRIISFNSGTVGESKKPAHRPLQEALGDTDPRSPYLPLNLPRIVSDLLAMQTMALSAGAKFAISTFVWLPFDGMKLDEFRQAGINFYINKRMWPASYADIRTLADYQNDIYRRLALTEGIGLIDYADRFPKDPSLFVDAIHMTQDGVRLQAWMAFQQIIPLIRATLTEDRTQIQTMSSVYTASDITIAGCKS